MKISRGTTRMTILIGGLAFKLPILGRSLKHFVKGWLGNLDESNIWWELKYDSFGDQLCPIYFSLFGLVNVMKRANPVTIEFNKQSILQEFKDISKLVSVDVCSGWRNFGIINGKLVLVDYATNRESGDECSDCDQDCILKN